MGGGIPRVEGGVTFFKGSKRGGVKKILKTEMKIYRPPLLIKNDTSLI